MAEKGFNVDPFDHKVDSGVSLNFYHSKKTADDFFGKFVEIVSDGDVEPASEVAEAERDGKLADSGHEQTISESGGLSPMVWGVGIVAIVAILLIIFGN